MVSRPQILQQSHLCWSLPVWPHVTGWSSHCMLRPAHVSPPTVQPLLSPRSAPSHTARCSRSSYTALRHILTPARLFFHTGGATRALGGRVIKCLFFRSTNLPQWVPPRSREPSLFHPLLPVKDLKSKTQMLICFINKYVLFKHFPLLLR